MTNQKRNKQERMLLFSRLVGAVEQRITNPRGNRFPKYAKKIAEWVALNPGVHRRADYPYPIPNFCVDRSGSTVYGLFWNNRLLKLGKTTWTSPAQAVATFNKYVSRVIALLGEDELNPLAKDLLEFANQRGYQTAKEITNAFRECGILQVRELETIQMPPDES